VALDASGTWSGPARSPTTPSRRSGFSARRRRPARGPRLPRLTHLEQLEGGRWWRTSSGPGGSDRASSLGRRRPAQRYGVLTREGVVARAGRRVLPRSIPFASDGRIGRIPADISSRGWRSQFALPGAVVGACAQDSGGSVGGPRGTGPANAFGALFALAAIDGRWPDRGARTACWTAVS